VEIHHVDLGTGYGPQDWPEEYVRRELQLTLATVPGRLADAAQRRMLLAWLTGRSPTPGELDLAGWESRPKNYFTGLSD
jgi:maleylpyruvate isomerase